MSSQNLATSSAASMLPRTAMDSSLTSLKPLFAKPSLVLSHISSSLRFRKVQPAESAMEAIAFICSTLPGIAGISTPVVRPTLAALRMEPRWARVAWKRSSSRPWPFSEARKAEPIFDLAV